MGCQVQQIHACLFSKAVNVFWKVLVAKLHKPTTQMQSDVLFTPVFLREMWTPFIYLFIHLLIQYLQTTCNGSLFCRLTGTLVSMATKKKGVKWNESSECLSFTGSREKKEASFAFWCVNQLSDVSWIISDGLKLHIHVEFKFSY